jgi:hypothetical protein
VTRRQPSQMRVQTEPGRFGPVSGTFCGLILALITAVAGDTIEGFQWWFPLPFAVAVSAAMWAARRKRRIMARTAWFTSVCVVVPAVWASVTISYGWSLAGLVILFACGVFAGVFANFFQTPPADVAAVVAAEQVQQVLAERDLQEAELEALIRDQLGTKKPIVVVKECDWPHDTGNTFKVEGARGHGFNYRWLTDIQVELAAALQLPVGCPVNAAPATTHQGAALLHVSRVNDMHLDIPFLSEMKPRSIRDDFPIGLFLDKSPTMINLFQDTTLVNGQKGSGKSVLLQSMVGNSLLSWNDALTGIVDLNGGRLFGPWEYLYAIGALPRSPLAFIAPTPRTALELALYLVELAKQRSAKYQQMMILHDVDVLPVGNGRDMCQLCRMIHPPALQIFVDEGGEMMGDDAGPEAMEAAAAFREVVRIARAMAINVILSTQRGTADYVPAQVKKAVSQMMTLRVADDSELSWLFGWKRGLSPEDLADHAGKGYIQRRNGAVRMFKAARLMPAQMTEMSRFVAGQEPALLEDSARELGGSWLSGLWQHPDIHAYLGRLSGGQRVADGSLSGLILPPGVTPAAQTGPGGQPGFLTGREVITAGGGNALGEAMKTLPPPPAANPAASSGSDPQLKPAKQMTPAEIANVLASLETQFTGGPDDDDVELDTGQGSQPAAKSAKAARYEFVVKTIVAAGAVGIKTEDVVKQTCDAGLARAARPQTVKETIGEALDAGDIAKKVDDQGQVVYAWWVGPDYAAR